MKTHKHRTLEDENIQTVLRSLSDERNTIETLALKGHLFIEYWLTETILDQMTTARELLESLSFYQKCLLGKALKFVEKDDFYDHLGILNQIRNRFAHVLIPRDIDDLIAKLPIQKADRLETLSHKHHGHGSYIGFCTNTKRAKTTSNDAGVGNPR